MGKSYTPTYRLELIDSAGRSVQSWRGKATDKRLFAYLRNYVKSLYIGGVNAHISEMYGFIPYPHKARIVRQNTDEIVCEWQAPTFMFWD